MTSEKHHIIHTHRGRANHLETILTYVPVFVFALVIMIYLLIRTY